MEEELLSFWWAVIPSRRAAHAFVEGGSKVTSLCGHSDFYTRQELMENENPSRRCEQCIITIVSRTSASTWKFFVGHVPGDVRRRRRLAWRAYRLNQTRGSQ